MLPTQFYFIVNYILNCAKLTIVIVMPPVTYNKFICQGGGVLYWAN